jgi:hypothetical protein
MAIFVANGEEGSLSSTGILLWPSRADSEFKCEEDSNFKKLGCVV